MQTPNSIIIVTNVGHLLCSHEREKKLLKVMSKMCYFHSAILTEVLHHRHQRHYEKRAEQQNCNIFSALSTMAWHGILSHSALLPVFSRSLKPQTNAKMKLKNVERAAERPRQICCREAQELEPVSKSCNLCRIKYTEILRCGKNNGGQKKSNLNGAWNTFPWLCTS